MRIAPPVNNQNKMTAKPRFAARFDWEKLPSPPRREYGAQHTLADVQGFLQKIAQDPVLKAFVLNQPNTDDIRFYFAERDKRQWGEHGHCYELRLSIQQGGVTKGCELGAWTSARLERSDAIVHSILSAFLQIVQARGLRPLLEPEVKSIPASEKRVIPKEDPLADPKAGPGARDNVLDVLL